MNEMGLSTGAKPVKSARVVGDVLGKYHPHGDQAAYDAMVRMAQSFTLRYPLVDGQGNFGSLDGDGAAAMRYTEARLTPIAALLLDEINQGTVDFVQNYDGSFQEPKLLPARLPFVLLNGASGIAVGMATEIPPHNLNEVAQATIKLIRNPSATLEELLLLLPGPDFPGGGQIISSNQVLHDVYASGKGSIRVRARWVQEDLAKGQWQLVIYELPPSVSSAKVLQEIEELSNPKIKLGKKSLLPEQQHLKAKILSLLDSVRDESGKEAAVRLVLEPKSRNVHIEELIHFLLTYTSLETNVSINLVTISKEGRPGQRGLIEILRDWIAFRRETVVKRCQHRLVHVEHRIHILEGRLIVWLNIDEVIAVIRQSEDPKHDLIQRFQLSDQQAEDILDIRLRQLARLEKIKIEKELQQLHTEQAELQGLLGDEGRLWRQIVAEIRKDAGVHGDARRTQVEPAKAASLELKVVSEPMTVVVSNKFWVRSRQGHQHDVQLFNFKVGDSLYGLFECHTTDQLYFFGEQSAAGKVFSVPVGVLPGGRGDGVPAQSLLDLPSGGAIAHALVVSDKVNILLACSHGYGFCATAENMQSRVKGGKNFISITPDDFVLKPQALLDSDAYVVVLSSSGRINVFEVSELKTLNSGGKGVQLMPLEDNETLIGCIAFGLHDGVLFVGKGRSGKTQTLQRRSADLMQYFGKRGRKGKRFESKFLPTSLEKIVP